MNRVTNKLYDKILDIKQYAKNNKKKFIFILLILFSLPICFVVFADTDAYKNGVTANVKETLVSTGTAPFDSGDEAGNDSNSSNTIVRTFDSVTYTINFLLNLKNSTETPDIQRNVIIDVLIPDEISTKVVTSTFNSISEPKSVSIDSKDYKYYRIDTGSIKLNDKSSVDITLSEINAKNGTVLSPIISIRESTDDDSKSLEIIESLNDAKNVIPDSYKKITVSAKSISPTVTAFPGNITKDGTKSSIPIGVMTSIPYDSKKGIKGIEIPGEITYDLSVTNTEGTLNYKDSSKYDSSSPFKINQMPNSPTTSTGTSLNGSLEKTDSTIKITDFTFQPTNEYKVDSTTTIIYITTNAFVYELDRGDSTNDIPITVKAGDSTITMTSYYSEVVGDLVSKISYVDSGINGAANTDTSKNQYMQSQVNPIYNYGEDFFIKTNLSYTNTNNNIGDSLNGMTSYIKFDNNAINILSMESGEDYYFSAKTKSSGDYDLFNKTIKFGIGNWSTDYFELESNLPSTCPTTLTGLSSNQLMNLYGGPCIKEKKDTEGNSLIKWDELANIDATELSNVIMAKFETSDKIYTASDINIVLHAKVISNSELIGNSYQAVTNSTTTAEDSSNNKYTYYLGETPNSSDIATMTNKDNYKKTLYENNSIISEQSPKGKYGNTLLVSAVKPKIKEINTYSDDIKKSSFIAGADDPIRWEIKTNGLKSSPDINYSSAIINVYVPNSLEYYQDTTAKIPVKTIPYDGGQILCYDFTKDEIDNDGNIILDVYTNIAPEAENSSQAEIKVEVDYTVDIVKEIINEDGSKSQETVSNNSIDPLENRTIKKSITIYNNRPISLSGTATPQLLELQKPYIYNMRAYNNNGSSQSSNLELINVLPYNSSMKDVKFDGTYSVFINSLPEGYTAYYSKEKSESVLSNEIAGTDLNKWVKWEDITKSLTGITAIKVVASSNISYKNYFGGKEGITLTITPTNNKIGNEYSNSFSIIDTSTRSLGAYTTGDSIVSVYNRRISGNVFEDYDYDGLIGDDESKLSDLDVELYKISNVPKDYDELKISDYMNEDDELIDSISTDKDGNYTFKGLEIGYYYVKVKFDSSKYTVTEFQKSDTSIGDTSALNSKFFMSSDESSAVSKVLYIDNVNLRQRNINLGLRLRQAFGISIDKYITNIKIMSDNGTENYDYNKAKQVKIDMKNLKNVTMEVTYKFEVENSKFFPGYIGTIVESIPDGMTFNSSLKENYNWSGQENIIYYNGLSDTLIMPGEKYYFQIKLILKSEQAGDYINVISAGDLRLMSIIDNKIINDNNDNSDSNEKTK